MMSLAKALFKSRARWLIVAGCACSSGCRPPPPAQPGQVARFHAASGGARWDAVGAIETTGELAAGGMTGALEAVEDVRTGRYRMTSKLGPLVVGEGFDGTIAWQQSGSGEVATLDAPEARRRTTTTRWITARGYFRASGASYRELGARRRGDRRLHGVEAMPAGGTPIELWFDDATGLLALSVHREGTDTVTTIFDDYRSVDGVTLPFRTVVDRGDPRDLQITIVTEAHVRGALGATAYARPATDVERLHFANGAHATQVPFELISNHIYIHAQVDGRPVRLIVDTGAVNLLTPAAAARLGLATTGKIAGSGAGETKVDVAIARGHELAVGDVRLDDPVFYVVDIPHLAESEGERSDGLVGFELFQRLGVRIDYPLRSLTLTRRDALVPPVGAIVVPFELRERIPIAGGSIDGIPARFTIDTGAGNSLTATSAFSRAHDLEARYRPAFETIVGWGVGGPVRGKPVRFKKIMLGDAEIDDVSGELFTGTQGAHADPDSSGNLGGGILRRFAVTFDYRDHKMYLQPGPALPRDIYDRAGFGFWRVGEALRVVAVTPGGPAERAGIAMDDRIVAIDGAPIASRPITGWRELLATGQVGARHTLTVESGTTRRDCALVLAELLP